MHSIIAMAGLAEAAFFYLLIIVAAVLLVVAGLLALAWTKRWPIVAAIACVICLLIGLLLQPWSAFGPPESPDDPDELHWLVRMRVASVIWTIVFLAGVACWRSIVRRRRSEANAQNSA
jgi:MFS family permease